MRTEVEDGVAAVVLARPAKLNALTRTGLQELREALEEVGRDANVRAVVLRGEGRSFCAGADVGEVMGDPDLARAADFLAALAAVVRAISLLPKPVVAAVQGHAAGGGAELALESDLRIAAQNAQLWFPDVGIGSTPATLWALYRCVGRAKATEMALLGTRLGAEEMFRVGLVTEIVPVDALEEAARSLGRRLASLSPASLRHAKHAIRLAEEASRDVDLAANVDAMLACWQLPEQERAAARFRRRGSSGP